MQFDQCYNRTKLFGKTSKGLYIKPYNNFVKKPHIFILNNTKNVFKMFRHFAIQPTSPTFHFNRVILETKSRGHKLFCSFPSLYHQDTVFSPSKQRCTLPNVFKF